MPIFQVLERLANCPDVYVVVISGRELDDLRQKVDVEGITYAACHGLHVMHADGQTYRHTISQGAVLAGATAAGVQRVHLHPSIFNNRGIALIKIFEYGP